jgi:hypothetical protein
MFNLLNRWVGLIGALKMSEHSGEEVDAAFTACCAAQLVQAMLRGF